MTEIRKQNFSDTVKNVVRGIPRGNTMSYKEVATQAGNPGAARAVARIMSTNFDPTIPCHRVICTNGALGGYNIGVRERGTLSREIFDIVSTISHGCNHTINGEDVKRRILASEGVIINL